MSDPLHCADNSCMFGFSIPGNRVGTNGGCRCFEVSTREELRVLRRKVAHALDYAKTEQAGFKVGADFVWAKVAGIMLDAKTIEGARSAILGLRSKLKQEEKCQP